MEDNDWVQRAKFVTDYTKIQTDDHGVEDDAELKDEECGDLLPK